MPATYLKATLKRVQQLEALRPSAARPHRSFEMQVQFGRSLFDACAGGAVVRRPEGYRAVGTQEGSKHTLVDYRAMAVLLNTMLWLTGKDFPIYEGLADQSDSLFLESIYRYYGKRVFE